MLSAHIKALVFFQPKIFIMKKNIFIVSCLLLSCFFLQGQTRDYKVVFDLTSNDTMNHKAVIRWLNEISKSNPDANLEVVFYGQSLDMVVKNKSVVAGDVTKFAGNKNIDASGTFFQAHCPNFNSAPGFRNCKGRRGQVV